MDNGFAPGTKACKHYCQRVSIFKNIKRGAQQNKNTLSESVEIEKEGAVSVESAAVPHRRFLGTHFGSCSLPFSFKHASLKCNTEKSNVLL